MPIIREMHGHGHLGAPRDEELLQNIGAGCADCFTVLFHRYCRQVFCVAYRILHDRSETEDVLQEVFLSIYLQQERFDHTRGSVRTWILQFAYFKALLRRRYLNIRNFYKQEEASESREARRAPSTDLFGMSPAERVRYVETGTARLSQRQRQVIELVHFDGYTLRETSKLLGETLANTRNCYYRGLKSLRSFLRERGAARKTSEEGVLERHDAYHYGS
jgi:RNA polymerase sigma-70 factor (ECF subfamily)